MGLGFLRQFHERFACQCPHVLSLYAHDAIHG